MTDEQPVFVDGTGKRRRLLRIAGGVSGVFITGYAIALGVGLITGTEVPLTTWVLPEKTRAEAEKAEPGRKSAGASAVPRPSAAGYPVPGASPSVSGTSPQTADPTPPKTTVRPGTAAESPESTESPVTETEQPSPSATPSATQRPSDKAKSSKRPTEPPGQQKKTAAE